jgi:hypothetical protein
LARRKRTAGPRGIQPENITIRIGLAGLPGTPRVVAWLTVAVEVLIWHY